MRKIIIQFFVALAVLAIIGTQAQATNLIVNGGFEEPNLASGTWNAFLSIPGWTTTVGHSIEVQDNVAGAPYEGGQHVELDSYGNSGMEQIISTVEDQWYDLNFFFSPRPFQPEATNGISVFWDGNVLDNITALGTNQTIWTEHSYLVQASSDYASLEFRATGISDYLGGYLDAVSLEAVPEPSTLLLLTFGLIGLFIYKKRMGQITR